MKNKILLTLIVTALVTLSFTFIKTKDNTVIQSSNEKNIEEPIGGFSLEDKH